MPSCAALMMKDSADPSGCATPDSRTCVRAGDAGPGRDAADPDSEARITQAAAAAAAVHQSISAFVLSAAVRQADVVLARGRHELCGGSCRRCVALAGCGR